MNAAFMWRESFLKTTSGKIVSVKEAHKCGLIGRVIGKGIIPGKTIERYYHHWEGYSEVATPISTYYCVEICRSVPGGILSLGKLYYEFKVKLLPMHMRGKDVQGVVKDIYASFEVDNFNKGTEYE